MPCAWPPCSNEEIESIRLRRRIERLERRLGYLTGNNQKQLYEDIVGPLQSELMTLRDRLNDG